MNPWLQILIARSTDGDPAATRALRRYAAPNAARVPRDKAGRFERDCNIAREVWKLNHQLDPVPLDSKTKTGGALSIIGEKYHRSPDRVKKIYMRYKWLPEAEIYKLGITPGHRQDWELAQRHQEADTFLTFARLVDVLSNTWRRS